MGFAITSAMIPSGSSPAVNRSANTSEYAWSTSFTNVAISDPVARSYASTPKPSES